MQSETSKSREGRVKRYLKTLPLAGAITLVMLCVGALYKGGAAERLIVVPYWTDPPASVVLLYAIFFIILYAKFGWKAVVPWLFVESLSEVAYSLAFVYNMPLFASLDPLFFYKIAFSVAAFAISLALMLKFRRIFKLNHFWPGVLSAWAALLFLYGLMAADNHYIVPPAALVTVQRAITWQFAYGTNFFYSLAYLAMWGIIFLWTRS